ncbi:MAG: protein kinase [Phycisphaerae bacterium]|jgi:serine/threonine protein kinase/WD40 repeat protein
MSGSTTGCPPPDVLEGIALRQPGPQDVESHVASCPACRQSLHEIQANNRFLSAFALDGALPSPPAVEPQHAIDIPGYDIVREIHRGGQGVVYQAVQRSTRRDVAIKVMKHGPFATLADRARFEREVETLSRLNHPNIVAVHDAGMIAGSSYFVMNYIDGVPLDEAQATGEREVIERFIQVCDAVHAAHLRGVIHRDLKPSNIRVDRAGRPHVLDFGLAKSLESEPDSAMTRTGQFVGSLPWASPEQIEGASSKVDLRTDVYSLGAILFQLLTGKLPFDVGSSLRDALDDILTREPPRPSACAQAEGRPRIDDELETIILRCLSKDRERRYQSAGELARDLRRYQAGEPIEAKRDSAVYLLRKTLRRYRMRVAAAGAFLVLLAVFSVVMSLLYRRSSLLEQQALRSAASLAELLSQSNIENGRLAGVLGNLEQAEQLLWRELLLHRHTNGDGPSAGFNTPPGPPEAYWALWELYRRRPCLRTLISDPLVARGAIVAANGEDLWTATGTGLIQLFSASGRLLDGYPVPVPTPPAIPLLAMDGAFSVGWYGAGCELRARGRDDPLIVISPAPSRDESFLHLSRSGRRFAALTEGAAVVWKTEPLEELARFMPESAEFAAIAISNDDRRVAVRDRLGGFFVWDVESRTRIRAASSALPERDSLRAPGELHFSPDDTRVADAWIETAGRIWDLTVDPPTATELVERAGSHRVQSFSPDGRLLAVADLGGYVRIFDARSGALVSRFVAHSGRVNSISFTGDGRGIWTTGQDGMREWEVGDDPCVRELRVPGELFHGLDFSRDGSELLSVGLSGVLHRTGSSDWVTATVAFGNDATISAVAVSDDGAHVAAGTYSGAAYVWSGALDASPERRLDHPNRLSYVAFNRDGSLLATACDDAVVRVWRVADGTLVRELHGAAGRMPQVRFDPTGQRVAAVVRDGSLLVWDLATGAVETWTGPRPTPLRTLRFTADGRQLVVGGGQRSVDIWDVERKRCVAQLVGHSQEIYCLDISPDGRQIASGDSGGVIRLWDRERARPLATLEGHTASVMALRFAPDGRTLASASLDQSVREWDLTYYDRHIAGQVDAQLRAIEPQLEDPEGAAAWRDWAAATLQSQARW